MKLGNNDAGAPWHVLVRDVRRDPPLWRFYGGYATEAEAQVVADDRQADPAFAQGGECEFVTRHGSAGAVESSLRLAGGDSP